MKRSSSEAFTVQETSAATGVSISSLHYWSGPARVIAPEVAHAGVQRSPKLFSPRNLVEVAVLKTLAERGVGLELWRELQQIARAEWWDIQSSKTEALVLVDGKRWQYLAVTDEEVRRQV